MAKEEIYSTGRDFSVFLFSIELLFAESLLSFRKLEFSFGLSLNPPYVVSILSILFGY
jgi:hypothetical protein